MKFFLFIIANGVSHHYETILSDQNEFGNLRRGSFLNEKSDEVRKRQDAEKLKKQREERQKEAKEAAKKQREKDAKEAAKKKKK